MIELDSVNSIFVVEVFKRYRSLRLSIMENVMIKKGGSVRC